MTCTSDPHEFARVWDTLAPVHRPCLRAAFLVRADGFEVAAASAVDNAYMVVGTPVDRARADRQLAALAATLGALGVDVVTFPGCVGQPDGVYPNNVWATAAGRLVIGSMRHPHRRDEAARTDVPAALVAADGYTVVDLSGGDGVGELTGVLAIDRRRLAAVCGRSSRVDAVGLSRMRAALGLGLLLDTPLVPSEYHLNMVFAVLAGDAVVVWPDAFVDAAVPEVLVRRWPGGALVLDRAEKDAFAANCLAVTPQDVVMSATAWTALRPTSRRWFAERGWRVHPVEVDELEKGGGSLRCLVAERF